MLVELQPVHACFLSVGLKTVAKFPHSSCDNLSFDIDIVSVWTMHNAFLKTSDANITLSDTLQQPQDLLLIIFCSQQDEVYKVDYFILQVKLATYNIC